MKLSILTATYNRAEFLERLYKSIVQNLDSGIEIEWLVMDDGSTDNTSEIIKKFTDENKIKITYTYQKNQGKMVAINNMVPYVTGDLIIDCDSDDYFTENAFKIIKEEYERTEKQGLYAICFLKQNSNRKVDGEYFKKDISTMFDLYFKENNSGEKILVYYAEIRKRYKHEIEKKEKFITEARMYHKMDEHHKIKCVNKPVIEGEYLENGYTSNILKTFKSSPYGYLKYFEEILEKDFKKVIWSKRIYVIKHYILFLTITNEKLNLKQVKNLLNKILIVLLLFPGNIFSKRFIKRKEN